MLSKLTGCIVSKNAPRLLSTVSSVTLHKFVVYAPDVSDSEVFQRRLSVRAQHLARADEFVQKGFISKSHAVIFNIQILS